MRRKQAGWVCSTSKRLKYFLPMANLNLKYRMDYFLFIILPLSYGAYLLTNADTSTHLPVSEYAGELDTFAVESVWALGITVAYFAFKAYIFKRGGQLLLMFLKSFKDEKKANWRRNIRPIRCSSNFVFPKYQPYILMFYTPITLAGLFQMGESALICVSRRLSSVFYII